MTIPKIIHYCWFGNAAKSNLALHCINSWKTHCSSYEIIEWNESNYDISSAPLYVQQAYSAQKWAFVSDYVRLNVIYNYGGIYLDTDVELLKPLDPFLSHQVFFSLENSFYVNTGQGFGAIQRHPIIKEMMDDYNSVPFILPSGEYDLTPCPQKNTQILLFHGLLQQNSIQYLSNDIVIYPPTFFNPKDFQTGKIILSPHTVSIHHYDGSWMPIEQKENLEQYRRTINFFGTNLGERILLAKKILKNEGPLSLLFRVLRHLK